MTTKARFRIQLYEAGPGGEAGPVINSSGGRIVVTKASNPSKATLYDSAGAAKTNSFALTYGAAEFYVDTETDSTVDVFIMAPSGQFVTKTAISPGNHEITVNKQRSFQLAKIPYSYADVTGDATETDTGFDLPAVCQVLGRLSGAGLYIVATDATETIDVGLLSSESGGDADGFIAASAISGTNSTLTIGTNGALFSTNAPHVSTAVTAKSISYTMSAGSDTGKGYILLPYLLC